MGMALRTSADRFASAHAPSSWNWGVSRAQCATSSCRPPLASTCARLSCSTASEVSNHEACLYTSGRSFMGPLTTLQMGPTQPWATMMDLTVGFEMRLASAPASAERTEGSVAVRCAQRSWTQPLWMMASSCSGSIATLPMIRVLCSTTELDVECARATSTTSTKAPPCVSALRPSAESASFLSPRIKLAQLAAVGNSGLCGSPPWGGGRALAAATAASGRTSSPPHA
mmetsp:Transcript_7150/g.20718  ORF Transcript_7150/g.20718 Transcript_7150/m.20718 type:complete len:228 (+) Transcript_7150:1532-2215(+)